ncbi:hypothetical protein PROFUN_14396 [Planoprotostelium fungivorum]|uniref:Endonuclease/exonuclease/phosphatase domain-containing protein n=1 Tax=Planoprotostelium fungivorum TaxID=1890364 RepID=A0A2P6N0D3_9EUKA|nr:hypothetical protein PROFUN_14396 [Planoprotostelium fungivorum]
MRRVQLCKSPFRKRDIFLWDKRLWCGIVLLNGHNHTVSQEFKWARVLTDPPHQYPEATFTSLIQRSKAASDYMSQLLCDRISAERSHPLIFAPSPKRNSRFRHLIQHERTQNTRRSDGKMNRYLRLMTFNLRYAFEHDGKARWEFRKDVMVNVFKQENPDIIATQEGSMIQLRDIEKGLDHQYAWFGVGRDDGGEEGESCSILYKKSRLQLLHHDNFWLSETQEVGKKGWGASYVRMCTWAHFKDITTEQEFLLFNSHLDNWSPVARYESAKLIKKAAKERHTDPSMPIFWTGDFNALKKEKVIQYIKNNINTDPFVDTRDVSISAHEGPNITFPGFDHASLGYEGVIDYIFLHDAKDRVKVLNHRTVFTPIDKKLGTPPWLLVQ